MTWQRVAALGLLVGDAVAAAAFHNGILAATFAGAAATFAGGAATFAGAAAGFAVNRDPERSVAPPPAPRKAEPGRVSRRGRCPRAIIQRIRVNEVRP